MTGKTKQSNINLHTFLIARTTMDNKKAQKVEEREFVKLRN